MDKIDIVEPFRTRDAEVESTAPLGSIPSRPHRHRSLARGRVAGARSASVVVVCLLIALFWGCSAGSNKSDINGNGAGTAGGEGGTGGLGDSLDCAPGERTCVGNEVHECGPDGMATDAVIETCDPSDGLVCHEGECTELTCELATDQPSNIGCEFWAVDLDQQDSLNDPASAPWGVVLSNAGNGQANVTIEYNDAAPGDPHQLVVAEQISVPPGALSAHFLPTRELDCGTTPNDYTSPGTCLSSRAFRITSSSPIVVYQINVFENTYSNDASLLLPSNALGKVYRVLGWPAGHPIPLPLFGNIVDRSSVTIVGTQDNTQVRVNPSWRIKGNPPIPATMAGGEILVTLGAFDVLNLETDDATFSDDPATMADLSGTLIASTRPVAVFSGVETTSAPQGVVDIPKRPGWTDDDKCCLDHLEEQMFPAESIGTKYLVTRSPIRSTGSYHEPDVLRFVGVAETATVTTTLPAPFDSFTLQPGEVKTTYAQTDVTVESDKPMMVGQILISNEYVDGPFTGDPSLTVYPPVEQYRTEYIILTPSSWTTNWVVIAAEVGTTVTIDGNAPTNCVITPAGEIDAVSYESRRCPLTEGVHTLSGDEPFGVVAYGYGQAGSYAFAGGADVKQIYEPPIVY